MDGSGLIKPGLTSIEVCAGAGGQALGLERAGFHHLALSEIEPRARETLRLNRPNWNVLEGDGADIKTLDLSGFRGVDLLAGGLPCPPFSVAGKQLGLDDERNLFPDFLRLVAQCRPGAVFIENVRGFLDGCFDDFRQQMVTAFKRLGYAVSWRLLHASDFGVSQLRPRVAIVALPFDRAAQFEWPEPHRIAPPSVGELLLPMISAADWQGARHWAEQAKGIAPTLVGGSKKHGGPDLGPTRARQAWERLGVNGKALADAPPEPGFTGLPKLTVQMTARLQGFPEDWKIAGKKTPAYRQVGNAFPPPVAEAVGRQIAKLLLPAAVAAQ